MNKFVRRILRQKKAKEKQSQAYFNKLFRYQIDLIIASYTGDLETLINAVPLIIRHTEPQTRNGLVVTWGECGKTFGYESRENTLANSKRIRRLRTKDATEEQWESAFERNAINYISSIADEKALQILGTNSNLIANELEKLLTQTIDEGFSIDETADLIYTTFKKWGYDMSKKRARVIARTEVNSASNWSQYDGAKSIGMPLEKRWSTSGLSNIRDSHLKCGAQGWIDENVNFINGLGFPGDQIYK